MSPSPSLESVIPRVPVHSRACSLQTSEYSFHRRFSAVLGWPPPCSPGTRVLFDTECWGSLPWRGKIRKWWQWQTDKWGGIHGWERALFQGGPCAGVNWCESQSRFKISGPPACPVSSPEFRLLTQCEGKRLGQMDLQLCVSEFTVDLTGAA